MKENTRIRGQIRALIQRKQKLDRDRGSVADSDQSNESQEMNREGRDITEIVGHVGSRWPQPLDPSQSWEPIRPTPTPTDENGGWEFSPRKRHGESAQQGGEELQKPKPPEFTGGGLAATRSPVP